MKKILFYIGGVLILSAGVLGLLLPVVPGWILIFTGLSLIAPRLAERLKRRILGKFFKRDIVYLEEWKKIRVHAGFTTKHFPLFLQNSGQLSEEGNQKKFVSLLSESSVIRSHSTGPLKRFAVLNQVHGDKIAVLSATSQRLVRLRRKGGEGTYKKEGFYPLPGCDAAVTNIPGLTILAFSADCLSIFFSAGEWVGLVHAGWRGSQNKIAQKTLKLLAEKSRRKTKHIRVIFGPAIGAAHYEVGPEFRGYFQSASLVETNGKLYFDLAKENARQLREAGAANKNVIDHAICTVAENDNFYSYRKEKDAAGRSISFIMRPE